MSLIHCNASVRECEWNKRAHVKSTDRHLFRESMDTTISIVARRHNSRLLAYKVRSKERGPMVLQKLWFSKHFRRISRVLQSRFLAVLGVTQSLFLSDDVLWRHRFKLACNIPLDSDISLISPRLCRARFIPLWKRNALWEPVNETLAPKISHLWSRVVKNSSFAAFLCSLLDQRSAFNFSF